MCGRAVNCWNPRQAMAMWQVPQLLERNKRREAGEALAQRMARAKLGSWKADLGVGQN